MIVIRHGESEFNRLFSIARRDPGIRDPQLTPRGRQQATAVAQAVRGLGLSRLIASPYTRALETAAVIAADLGLPLSVEPLIGERSVYACDIGSPVATLTARWPALAFDHLADPWWPAQAESEESLAHRARLFQTRIAAAAWSRTAIVSHWGFIRALTGLTVPNGAVLRIDPTQPEAAAEPVFFPDPA